MEEKRSVHSLRSTRSYLSRPMSDISYVDEDTLSPSAISHHYRGRSAFSGSGSAAGQPASNNNKPQQGMMRHSLLVTDTSAFTPVTNNSTNMAGQQYLKVEGTAYRVHHRQQTQPQQRNRNEAAAVPPAPARIISADAQTQSAESSFLVAGSTQTVMIDDYQQPLAPLAAGCGGGSGFGGSPAIVGGLAGDLSTQPQPPPQHQPPPQVIYTSLTPTPQQQQLVGGPPCVQIVSTSPQIPARGSSPVAFVSGRATPGGGGGTGATIQAPPPTASAVTVQHAGGALQTHLLPSPLYAGYGGYNPGYDPSYCQYLGQAADGYQYEMVRRPSIGPLAPSPAELLVPTAAGQATRRLSSSGTPYLAPNSMQTSIDSVGVPPPIATPIFIQQSPQPLSPRHLPHPQPVSPIPPYHLTPIRQAPQPQLPPGIAPPPPPPAGSSSSSNNPAQSSDPIPKLIHETSI